MAYILRDRKCERCQNKIEVLSADGVVDCGKCVSCGKIEILPQENYREFINEFCIREIVKKGGGESE